MATKVKLRSKQISGNRQSLYLDFYPPIKHPTTGELTRREFLGLTLIGETEHEEQKYLAQNGNPQIRIVAVLDKKGEPKKRRLSQIDKNHNRDTMVLAEQIRQKRENQINKPEIYTAYEKEQLKLKEYGELSFVEYFKTLADKRKTSNHDNWMSAYKYLHTFTNGDVKFADVNEKFCNDFRDFLLTTKSTKSSKTSLSQNSCVSYFNKVKATLKQAYKDGLLQTNLNARVESIKPAETRRNFLTNEELNALAKTECQNDLLKRAALFSALTGLRFSDIAKLVWKEVEYINGDGYVLHFSQQKTKGVEVLPISDQAYSLLGDRKNNTDQVFKGLTYSAYANKHLYQWIGAAGITKEITFHCFRHSYATLQVSKGTHILTVSKMLGHRNLRATQVYTKIVDKAKREAANKIMLELDEPAVRQN